MDAIPSAPGTIYRNMLILEESLRTQYSELRARRARYALFVSLLCIWTAYFYHAVFIFAPSPYGAVRMAHKLGFVVGVVTFAMFYVSGLYHSAFVAPRRFLPSANKGLRQFNLRLVMTDDDPVTSRFMLATIARHARLAFYWIWYREMTRRPKIDYTHPPSSSVVSAAVGGKNATTTSHHRRSSSSSTTSSRPRRRSSSSDSSIAPPFRSRVPASQSTSTMNPSSQFASSSSSPATAASSSQAALPFHHYYALHYTPPGGGLVKIVMLPKAFSTDFREAWEVYRRDYWLKENRRRAQRATGQLPCSCTYS
ncbi:Sporulation/nuclear morphology [Limtongia smithiae]|uniref:Sporulation/nuclear morphology n=1 Tax=Limtongia smithiae TaxID=1125753 RepID=UPI0034CFD2C4